MPQQRLGAHALAATGKTAKAGLMWYNYNLKGMMLNGEELLCSREIQREDWAFDGGEGNEGV
jgi:hypothetical protein